MIFPVNCRAVCYIGHVKAKQGVRQLFRAILRWFLNGLFFSNLWPQRRYSCQSKLDWGRLSRSNYCIGRWAPRRANSGAKSQKFPQKVRQTKIIKKNTPANKNTDFQTGGKLKEMIAWSSSALILKPEDTIGPKTCIWGYQKEKSDDRPQRVTVQ